jgi:putative YhbY family RNA-binding protein
MEPLSPSQRRELRAKAHHLDPVVSIGNQGLTPAVLHEIDVNLLAHQLIKVRVFSGEREHREAMLQRICDTLDASPVQHIGKLLVLWRRAPDEGKPTTATLAPRARVDKAKTMAKSTPQARRPRSPLARTTARGTPPRAPSSRTRTASEQARRRRRGA